MFIQSGPGSHLGLLGTTTMHNKSYSQKYYFPMAFPSEKTNSIDMDNIWDAGGKSMHFLTLCLEVNEVCMGILHHC